jgi:hypothetical protein
VQREKQFVESTVMILGNNMATRQLDKPITGSFTLAMEMLHTNYQRGGTIVLLDQAGKQGYGFLWDSSNEKFFNGQGAVSLLKFDEDKPYVYATHGKRLTPGAGSGHIATQQPMAVMQLTFDATKGELKLSVDGVVKATAKDGDFSRFDQLVLRGNTSQLFDNIVLRPGVHE